MSVPDPAATKWVPIWNLAEAPPAGAELDYSGDYAAGTYSDGDVVVYQGIAYLCVKDTNTPPEAWPGGPPLSPAYPRPSYGTSFPASPVDGQEHILVDSLTAPTYQWHFRYNASATGNKWEFIGGPPAWREDSATVTLTLTSVWHHPSVVPEFIVPRPGLYRMKGDIQNVTQGSGVAWYTGIANASLGTTPITLSTVQSAPAWTYERVSVDAVAPVNAAGQTLRLACYLENQPLVSSYRSLSVVPVRVS